MLEAGLSSDLKPCADHLMGMPAHIGRRFTLIAMAALQLTCKTAITRAAAQQRTSLVDDHVRGNTRQL